LIAKIYNLEKIGFLSTLFGASFVSYYYRTHLGYFDTDLLNLFFPMFSIYFLIKYIHTKYIKYILYALIWLLLFYFWYHSSLIIILSIVVAFMIYILIYENVNRGYMLLAVVTIIIAINIFDTSILDRAIEYLDRGRDIAINSIDGAILKFKGALSDVAEAKAIDLYKFIGRVSGNIVYFIISIVGYVVLVVRYRSLILTLPLIFIAFLSLKLS